MADINTLIKDINKRFGVNAIRKGADINDEMNFKIPLGSVSLNDALGGGLPSGRYITLAGQESSGKSLLAYKAIAAVQNMYKKKITKGNFEYEVVADDGDIPLQAALIQIESGSYSEEWGAQNGIDNDKLLFCQPEGMEQALDIAVELQKAGVEFIVIDSIAAMLPTKYIETDISDTAQMGIKPLKLQTYHGKFQSFNNTLERNGKLPTTVLSINQFRDKIGGYGDPTVCLHGETNVVFVDGRTIPIEKVVREKIKGKVWALNEATGKFEQSEIVDWMDNGKLKADNSFYTITTNGVGSKNGKFSITTTLDHRVLTTDGWKFAEEVKKGDYLITKKDTIINGTLKDFLAGTLVGDCSLILNGNTANLSFQDKSNKEYLEWKVSKLSNAFTFKKCSFKNSEVYRSNYTVELASLKPQLVNRDINYLLNNFSDLGLAVYYMDDGCLDINRNRAFLTMKRFKNNNVLDTVNQFFNDIGLECSVDKKCGKFNFTANGSKNLFKRIYKYVPPCMQYKLPLEFRGMYEDFDLNFNKEVITEPVLVLEAGIASKRKFRNKHLYDLKIEKNHNFLAGGTGSGLVVHNCPGGNSQKYTNSLEIRLRAGDYIKEGTGTNAKIVGRVIKWKIQKNKLGAAFTTGEYDLYTDDGLLPKGSIDTAKELVVLAVIKGIIERRGSWFYFHGNQLAQGQDNLIALLRENQDLFAEIIEAL